MPIRFQNAKRQAQELQEQEQAKALALKEAQEKQAKKAAAEQKRLEKRHRKHEIETLQRGQTAEKKLERDLQIQKAVKLRLQHCTYQEISEQMNLCVTAARELVCEGMQQIPEDTVSELRKMIQLTIDKLLKRYEAVALDGDLQSAEFALKSIDRIMKLTGLGIQKNELEITNLGNAIPTASGEYIDIADLNLDLETKRKILDALRELKDRGQTALPETRTGQQKETQTTIDAELIENNLAELTEGLN